MVLHPLYLGLPTKGSDAVIVVVVGEVGDVAIGVILGGGSNVTFRSSFSLCKHEGVVGSNSTTLPLECRFFFGERGEGGGARVASG